MEHWGMLNKFNICLNTDKYRFFLRNGGNGAELALEREVPPGAAAKQQLARSPKHSAGHFTPGERLAWMCTSEAFFHQANPTLFNEGPRMQSTF